VTVSRRYVPVIEPGGVSGLAVTVGGRLAGTLK